EPRHPYSQKLFRSLPGRMKRGVVLDVIAGSVPRLDQEFHGCRFTERCDFAWDRCRLQAPRWSTAADHGVRCHLYDAAAAEPAAERSGKRTTPAVSAAGARDAGATSSRVDSGAAGLLEARGLKVYFPVKRGLLQRVVDHVRAVDDVSFTLQPARTLALVGESGSGKTTIGKAVLQLIRPTDGDVLYQGQALTRLGERQLRGLRREFQIIFQDPYASLDPRMQVGEILEEGMRAQRLLGTARARALRATELLAQVGLPASARHRYPHEFSGGQRQRISIARALAVEPRLIVCDEPTSALDVSVQAQILNLLRRLQDELGLAYLFITHNLAVVEYLADEIAVMHRGCIVEQGSADDVLSRPKHTYTKTLLAAVPKVELPEMQRPARSS
ncbi:MAG: oligopeptide/dipeptide ABC transporter ATP-binding protein, partial [Sulfurifustaceae bacterium]